MNAALTFDVRELNAAIAQKVARTQRDMAGIVNQTAFNVAARAMRATKQADAGKVRQYLVREVGAKHANGGSTGAYTPAKQNINKRANRRGRRVVLIAQALYFKAHGKGIGKGKSNRRRIMARVNTAQQKSLVGRDGKLKVNDYGHSLAAKQKNIVGSPYGLAMMKYAGKLFNRSVRSVGFLSAAWVPVLRALAPLAKFKGLATGLRYGALWKTGGAYGTASPATAGENVSAILTVGVNAKRMTPAAEANVRAALAKAIADESAEMQRHEREILEGTK